MKFISSNKFELRHRLERALWRLSDFAVFCRSDDLSRLFCRDVSFCSVETDGLSRRRVLDLARRSLPFTANRARKSPFRSLSPLSNIGMYEMRPVSDWFCSTLRRTSLSRSSSNSLAYLCANPGSRRFLMFPDSSDNSISSVSHLHLCRMFFSSSDVLQLGLKICSWLAP